MPTSIHDCLHDRPITDIPLGLGLILKTDVYAPGDDEEEPDRDGMSYEQLEGLLPVAVWVEPNGSSNPSDRSVLTVNLVGYPIPPGHILVRTTEENEDVATAARRCGLFEDTKTRVACAHILLELWRVVGWTAAAAGAAS